MCPEPSPPIIRCRSRWPDREDRRIEAAAGESLFDALRRCDQPVASSCRGSVVCGRCLVQVLEGGEGLSPMDEEEREVLKREGAASDQRLACRAYPQAAEVVVTTGYW